MVEALNAYTGRVRTVPPGPAVAFKRAFAELEGVDAAGLLVLSVPDGVQLAQAVDAPQVCVYPLTELERLGAQPDVTPAAPESADGGDRERTAQELHAEIRGVEEALQLAVRHVQKHIQSVERRLGKRRAQFAQLQQDLAVCARWHVYYAALARLPSPACRLADLLDHARLEADAARMRQACDAAAAALDACTGSLRELAAEFTELKRSVALPAYDLLQTSTPDLLRLDRGLRDAKRAAQRELVLVLAGVKRLQQRVASELQQPLRAATEQIVQCDASKSRAAAVVDIPFLYGVLLIEASRREAAAAEHAAASARELSAQSAWAARYFAQDSDVGALCADIAERMGLQALAPARPVGSPDRGSQTAVDLGVFKENMPGGAVVTGDAVDVTDAVDAVVAEAEADTESSQDSRDQSDLRTAGVAVVDGPSEVPPHRAALSVHAQPGAVDPVPASAAERMEEYFRQLELVNLAEIAEDLRNELDALRRGEKPRSATPPEAPFAADYERRIRKLETLLMQSRLAQKTHELDVVRAEARGEALCEARHEALIDQQTRRIAQLERELGQWRAAAEQTLNLVGLQSRDGDIARVKGMRTSVVSAASLTSPGAPPRECSARPAVAAAAVGARFADVEHLARALRAECRVQTQKAADALLDAQKRVKLSEFEPNDLALFIPELARGNFNHKRPYHYKWVVFGEPDVYLHPRYYKQLRNQEYLVARIDSIEQHDSNGSAYKIVTLR